MTTPIPAILTVEMPLPPAGLNPNGSRGHWSKRATAAAAYREFCGWTLFVQNGRAWNHVPFFAARLHMRFVWCTGRRAWDADNALSAAKPLVDALRDAHILRDDSAKRVSYGAVESVHCPPKCGCGGRVEVTIIETVTA